MRPTKLLFLLSAALLLLLAGCASQAPATDQEEAAAPAPTVTETAAPQQGGPGEPLIFLKGDGQGMVTTRWAEGDRAVQVTLPFTYTTQENGEMRIAGIGEATIENLGGGSTWTPRWRSRRTRSSSARTAGWPTSPSSTTPARAPAPTPTTG